MTISPEDAERIYLEVTTYLKVLHEKYAMNAIPANEEIAYSMMLGTACTIIALLLSNDMEGMKALSESMRSFNSAAYKSAIKRETGIEP